MHWLIFRAAPREGHHTVIAAVLKKPLLNGNGVTVGQRLSGYVFWKMTSSQ